MPSRSKWSCFAAILCMAMASLPVMAEETTYPLTITDSAGRTITIAEPVQRIIVLSTDHAEAVTVLGDADKIVGVADDLRSKAELFPGLKNKQGVGKWSEINFEMIGEIARESGSIEPDIIVIAYTYPDRPYGAANVAKALEPFRNITVVGLDFYKPESLTQDVTVLGKILNRNDEACRYLNWVNASRQRISSAVEGGAISKVYFESSSKGGPGSLSTYGRGSGINQMIQMSYGFNIAKELDMYPKVSWEWVVTENPDVIIRIQSSDKIGWDKGPSEDSSKLKAIVDEIGSREGGERIPAIAGERVYVVYWNMMFGMDSVVGQSYLAKLLHPDAELAPEGVYREYLDLLGVEYPEDRIFVYPSLE